MIRPAPGAPLRGLVESGSFHSASAALAARVREQPDLIDRPAVVLGPVVGFRGVVGMPADLSPHGVPGLQPPSALDVDPVLVDEVTRWHEYWQAGFRHLPDRSVDEPVWAPGADPQEWSRAGERLALRLQAELAHHVVFADTDEFTMCPLAASRRAQTHPYYGSVRRASAEQSGRTRAEPTVRIGPEYGVRWGLWTRDLPFREPPRLLDHLAFSTPRSLGLSAELESDLDAWLQRWSRDFVDHSHSDRSDELCVQSQVGARQGGWGLPEWRPQTDPVRWYQDGLDLARRMSAELPGVRVSLAVESYVCNDVYLFLTRMVEPDTSFRTEGPGLTYAGGGFSWPVAPSASGSPATSPTT